jgi:hypothetical protein
VSVRLGDKEATPVKHSGLSSGSSEETNK